MNPSTVYFTTLRTQIGYGLLDKTRKLFEVSGFGKRIDPGDKVAVKLHFGEAGNVAFLAPPFARVIVEEIRKAGGKPFLIDTNTLYKGSRSNAVDHIETAMHNGFSFATIGAPVIIGDGLTGRDYVRQQVDGKHFSRVKIASGFHYADAVVNLTHFTGHELFGFGGVLKGLGMGCAAPSGKQEMHSDVLPSVKEAKCVKCGRCFDWCPTGAVEWEPGRTAFIVKEKCIGCGECVVACNYGAISVQWQTDPAITQEKTAEYAAGALRSKKGKGLFYSYLLNVSPDCDCYGFNDPPFAADAGILASFDPVAIDQAGVDIVNGAQGLEGSKLSDLDAGDKLFSVTGIRWEPILAHAEELGLGSRKYDLIEIP